MKHSPAIRYLLFLLATLLVACTSEPSGTLTRLRSAEAPQILQVGIPGFIDTLHVKPAEKRIATAAPKPTVYFDPTVVDIFSNLALETAGELYYSKVAEDVTRVITRLLKKHAHEKADVVFLIDNTGSMWDDIMQIKATANDFLTVLEALPNVRVGVASYGDKNVDGPGWFHADRLTSNFESARKSIRDIDVNGGGDYPESVYDAMMRVLTQYRWDDGQRMILLLGDAPPLEGTASQFHLEDVLEKAKSARVDANVFPIVIGQGMMEIPAETSDFE